MYEYISQRWLYLCFCSFFIFLHETALLTADSCFLALLIPLSHTLSTFLLRLIDFRQSPHPSPIPLTKRHRTPRPAVLPRIYHVQLVRKRRYNPISSRKQILCRLCPRRIFRYNTTTLSYLPCAPAASRPPDRFPSRLWYIRSPSAQPCVHKHQSPSPYRL